jgi:hypothetical protein
MTDQIDNPDEETEDPSESLDPHRSDEGVRVVSLSLGDTLQAWKDALKRLKGDDS